MQCDRLSPVEQPDLLHHIFSFLGRESYLFVAPVCKIWRETYRRATGSETPQTKVLYALENLAVLQFGKANKLSWDAKCFALLCGKGDLPMVLWAAQNNIPFDYRALCCAARSGALPVVMYLLHKHGIVKAVEGQDVCAAAAAGGHLHVLKYLRDHGFHWDDMVTLEAAYYGHLHIIEYARSQNCPWHTNVASVAAYNGDLELLKVSGMVLDVHRTHHSHNCNVLVVNSKRGTV